MLSRRLTPLFFAMFFGVGIEAVPSEPVASLVEAARNRDPAVVAALLEQGAEVNATAPDSATGVHWAVRFDMIDTARLLIRDGADVNAANRYGVRPLTLACINGSATMVELLLEASADPGTSLPEGETALMTCARTGRLAAVQALLARDADANAKETWRQQTAVMWAAAEGHTEVVKALIESGAKVDARSGSGFTPLLFAVREGQIDVVKVLLDAGADVNEALPPKRSRSRSGGYLGTSGPTALELATANAHYTLGALLLEAGASPNGVGQGWGPLHNITWVRKPGTGSNDPAPPGSGDMTSLEFVRLLVRHGANVNARMAVKKNVGLTSLNTVGATPFLLAARTGDAELMRLLIELGADPLLPSAEGSTPLMVAAGLGTRSPGEDAGAEPHVLEAVSVALEAGNDIDAVDQNGETAMHGAAYKQLPSVVRFLAKSGADITVWDQKNSNGWTPLRIAAGVHRTGNFRGSAETAEAFREVMKSAGVSTDLESESTAVSSER